jgi:steroid 5-alpha reductase family enzyme
MVSCAGADDRDHESFSMLLMLMLLKMWMMRLTVMMKNHRHDYVHDRDRRVLVLYHDLMTATPKKKLQNRLPQLRRLHCDQCAVAVVAADVYVSL